MDPVQEIKAMLEDVQKNFTFAGEDGQVIKITDIFKLYPELQAKYGALETRLAEIEKQSKSRKWATDAVPGLENEKKQFSMFRALMAVRSGKPLDQWESIGAGLEAEVFRQTKAMGTSSDTAGGYLVPVQAMPEYIEMLMAEMVSVALGARIIPGLTGSPVQFPKQTGGATAYWIGENTAITPSDLAFGQLQMTPKKVAALVQLSNDLVAMAQPEAEALVRSDLARTMGLAIDLAVLRGTGQSNQPKGIANTENINTVVLGDNGATIANADLFIDIAHELAIDNALRGKLGFAFHPTILKILRKIKIPQFSGDTGGQPLVAFLMALSQTNYLSEAAVEGAIGYPFKTTTQIPVNLVKGSASNCTEVYFANWLELLIGQWQGLEILASNVAGTAFATDQIWIRIISRVDVGLRHPESFCLCNDLKIA